METQNLDAGVFGTERGAVCRESTPRARPSHKPLRASMAYCLVLFTTNQLYSIVLGRFYGERVTGRSSEVESSEVGCWRLERSESEVDRSNRGAVKTPSEPKTQVSETPRFKRSGQAGTWGSQKRGERKVKTRTLENREDAAPKFVIGLQGCATRLAFIDDLDVVAVRIKHPGGIIARIVFGTRLRWFLTLSSSC